MSKPVKTITITFALILLTAMILPLMMNQTVTTAGAQTTVSTNLLQYEWLGIQGNLNTHFSAGPAPNSPDILWQRKVASSGYGSYSPVAFNGMLFITQGTNVTAINPLTGDVIYNAIVPTPVTGRSSSVSFIFKIDGTHMGVLSSVGSTVTPNQTLLAAWTICCLNTADGSLLWSMPSQYGPGNTGYPVPVYVQENQMLYITVGDPTGKGNTQSPGILQAWSLSDPISPPTLAWNYTAFGPIITSQGAVYGDGRIFLENGEPHQTCLNATNGDVLWDVLLTGAPSYGGSYYKGVLYRGLLDNTFIALNGTNGDVLWKYNPEDFGFWSSASAAAYGMVYELNVDGYLYALDAATGQVVWKYLGSHYYPGCVQVADGKIYACTGEPSASPVTGQGYAEFSCLNAFTGQVIWQQNRTFWVGPFEMACIAYGNFYGVDSGNLYCFSGTPKDWTMFGSDSAHTASGSGGPVNMTLNWKFKTNGAVVSSPAVVNGSVYVGSDDRNLYCLDSDTGAKLWRFKTGYYIRSSPAVINTRVYTGADDGYFYCLNALTGDQLWKTPAPGYVIPIMTGTFPQFASSPNVFDGKVYAGALDGKMYCLNANTGSILWAVQTTNAILSSPTYVNNDGLYFASIDGFVYKVNPNSGSVVWNVSTPIGLEIAMEGSPCVGNGMVVIGSGAAKNSPAGIGQMYCLNATTGATLWTYTLMRQSGNLQPTWTALYRSDSLGPVFYFADYFNIDCVNATNGKLIWTSYLTREHFSLPAYADGKIYVGSNSFGIYVIDANSGQKIGYYETGAEVEGSTAIYENRVYFGSLNWGVYCIGQSSSKTTTYGPFLTASSSDTQIKPNEAVTVSGNLSPLMPSATVTVTFVKPDQSFVDLSAPVDSIGAYSTTYSPDSVGTWTIVASLNSTGLQTTTSDYYGNVAAHSQALTVNVASPSSTPSTTPSPISTPTSTPIVTPTPTVIASSYPTTSPSDGGTLSTGSIIIALAVVVIVVVAAVAIYLRRRK